MAQQIDPNKLAAIIRQQNDRIAEMEKALKEQRREQGYVSFKEKTIRDSLKVTAGFYVWEIAFVALATQRTQVTIQTDPRGYFFAERIWCAWRPTAGALSGFWQGVSSDNPMIMGGMVENGAVGLPAPWPGFDFYWEYAEGAANLMRMNAPVSGAILYRGDMDGCIPGSDGWQPSSSVTFWITPIGAGPAVAGVFHLAVLGQQCYQTVV
jgi:hypothetical protein